MYWCQKESNIFNYENKAICSLSLRDSYKVLRLFTFLKADKALPLRDE